MSWNVKSLNHAVKRKKGLSHLNQILGTAFLQEIHRTMFEHYSFECRSQFYHINVRSKSRGAAILKNKNVPFIMSAVKADSTSHCIIMVGRLNKILALC